MAISIPGWFLDRDQGPKETGLFIQLFQSARSRAAAAAAVDAARRGVPPMRSFIRHPRFQGIAVPTFEDND